MHEFYVSKSGNDRNDGSEKAPFLTIEKAQSAIRQLIKDGLSDDVTVFVLEGEYEIDGLRFDENDSGTDNFSVTYKAVGEVTLNGAKKLDACDFSELNEDEKSRLSADAAKNVRKVDLKKYGLTRADWGEICIIGSYTTANKYDDAIISPMWCELFVGGERMTIARYPNEGFLYTGKVVREGQGYENADAGKLPNPKEWEKLRNPIGDIRKIDPDTAKRAAGWRTPNNVQIYGYPHYGWADESNIVTKIDEKECTMETAHASYYGVVENAPYYFFNVFEELDKEGEWFLDRDNGILYLYPPKKLEECVVELSITTDPIISVNNAHNIAFCGFKIASTRGDAVKVYGNSISFEKCEIKNCAGWGMIIDGYNNLVSRCHIHHTGRGGVDVYGGDRKTLTSCKNVITNNHIHHIAEVFSTYNPGVKMDGVNCVVSHNCIHNSTHQAICFLGNDHVIEYNEIYDVCLDADDSGAIYSGRDYATCGNVIRYNYFHDMSSEMETQHIGIFAVYCDDNLGATSIYGNIMHRCQSSLLLHGGHNMIFKNNLIIDSCKKSTCCLAVHRYGYHETLTGDGHHIKRLALVPWQGELWTKKYPHIAEYLSWHYENEQPFPHYCDISNNVIVSHKDVSIDFPIFKKEYRNKMINNIQIKERSFAEISCGDTLAFSNTRLSSIIPDFEPIPLEMMGILPE